MAWSIRSSKSDRLGYFSFISALKVASIMAVFFEGFSVVVSVVVSANEDGPISVTSIVPFGTMEDAPSDDGSSESAR